MKGADLRLKMKKEGEIHIIPSIASYVGADIVSGLASVELPDEKYALFIDIGTNGEIALANNKKVFSCATAAGPAFEGANIEHGVGGIEGAISEYENGNITTIGKKPAIGICGSGLIDIVAALVEEGKVDFMGFMEEPLVLTPKKDSGTDHDICIFPEDIRQVQLAKAAIAAGIKILIKAAEVNFKDIECLYLAGGFGNYIRVESAIKIGLLPSELEDRIIPIGNSAGTGAKLSLISKDFNKRIHKVISHSEYLELSLRADFNMEYVEQMNFM